MHARTICCVGGSHLAAVKQAWDDTRLARPDIDITFFGSTESSLKGSLRVAEGALSTDSSFVRERFSLSSGGKTSIRTNDYSEFFVFGPSFSIKGLLKTYADCRTVHLHGWSSSKRLVSDPCFQAAITDGLHQAEGLTIACMLGQLTNAPITLVFQAMPSSDLLSEASSKNGRHVTPDMLRSGDDTRLLHMYAIAQASLARSGNFNVINQPSSTKCASLLTRSEYASAPAGWIGSVQDSWHMNKHYGAKILDLILGAPLPERV